MSALKDLPKIDKVALHPLFQGCNASLIMKIARKQIDTLRHALL